jgi:hypothetical protein
MYIPNGQRTKQTFSFTSPSKIYPNGEFWFENIPSGNPGFFLVERGLCVALLYSKRDILAQKKCFRNIVKFATYFEV